MIPTRRPPGSPPPSVGVLAKYAQAYARTSSVSEGRVRTWISYMITAGALEQATANGHPHRSGVWASIAVDIARAESSESEIEWLKAIPLTDAFGVTGPDALPCLPLRLHVAQKLHGMTLPPRPGKRNERFRDLIDLLLMETLVADYKSLREACEAVFLSRGTHSWPPSLDLPEHWIEPVIRLAQELNLPIADAGSAMARVRAFVDRIAGT